jgi:hypothetical protein
MKSFTLALLACPLLAGCYTYRPLGPADVVMPAAGSKVEVRLTTAGTTALTPQVGSDVLDLEGDVVSADSSGLTLAVTRSENSRHIGTEWKGEHVAVPREDIATVKGRKFSVGATALLGGLTGGGLAAAIALIGGTNTTTATAGGPPGPGPQ